ncbi:unnamed protein product [Paramecium primaurelia]|uniref:Uncharacterized protein n=1 Tax=Paramecium primaurelia TaxID=5886 RepID=A0A8S1LXU0_PARPR|nr:unnamed protein product [Paramecium primaurelia]
MDVKTMLTQIPSFQFIINIYKSIVDLFTRSSMKLQSQLKNLDIYILYILISLLNSEIMHQETYDFNNVFKISISYCNAVKLFKVSVSRYIRKQKILYIQCSSNIQNILHLKLTKSKFALLIPIITKKQNHTLNSQFKQEPKQPGLGIGRS